MKVEIALSCIRSFLGTYTFTSFISEILLFSLTRVSNPSLAGLVCERLCLDPVQRIDIPNYGPRELSPHDHSIIRLLLTETLGEEKGRELSMRTQVYEVDEIAMRSLVEKYMLCQ